MADECVFCSVVAGKFGTPFVYEDDAVVAFNDLRPMAPVHILIVPREHHASLTDAAGGEVSANLLGRLLKVAADLGKEHAARHGGYRVVINDGPTAGQTVFHLHLHMLSGRHFAWPPG
jgi:histidine triad (HIT) family protein